VPRTCFATWFEGSLSAACGRRDTAVERRKASRVPAWTRARLPSVVRVTPLGTPPPFIGGKGKEEGVPAPRCTGVRSIICSAGYLTIESDRYARPHSPHGAHVMYESERHLWSAVARMSEAKSGAADRSGKAHPGLRASRSSGLHLGATPRTHDGHHCPRKSNLTRSSMRSQAAAGRMRGAEFATPREVIYGNEVIYERRGHGCHPARQGHPCQKSLPDVIRGTRDRRSGFSALYPGYIP
jgi:hypothetical protein